MKNKIGHPIFIISLILLIANDWYFKAAFHNEVTGKLSDFSGLFAFPFLFSILFHNQKKGIHLLTAIVFVLWNSQFSQCFIDSLNSLGLPVIRTIDFTDNIALLSIGFSYQALKKEVKYQITPILFNLLIAISCFSFIATSMTPYENRKFVDIDKEYHFNCSRNELITRFNLVQMKEVQKYHKRIGPIFFNSKTNTFHFPGHSDTLALLLDGRNFNSEDTIVFKTSFAEMKISGDLKKSEIELLSVYRYIPYLSDKDYKDRAINQFERRVIRKIRKYTH